MITGIYKITNQINGHYYIGQSVDIKNRFRSHIHSGINLTDKDHNTPIHLAIYKYGKDNFSFEILEECNREDLDEKEIYWIDKLQATKNGNYNILKGGQDRQTFDNKPVELYDLQGNYIKTIPSATQVAEGLQVARSTIYQVLHKQRPTCKNYQMKYSEDLSTIIKPFISRQGGAKQIAQIDIDTNTILHIYNSIAEASRLTKIDSSSISKVCKNKLKSCGGFKWKYLSDIEEDN